MVQLGYNVFDIEAPDKTIETYEDYLAQSGIRDLIRYAATRSSYAPMACESAKK
jgi:hypothetical protein